MLDLIDYLYKTVRIRTRDGSVFVGDVVTYENAIEHDLSCDAIGLEGSGCTLMFDADDVASIEIIP